MAKVAQHLMDKVGLHLRHAPADTEAVLILLGLPDLDPEAMLQDFAAPRPHVDLYDVIPIAQ